MAVTREYRGQGIGRRLAEAAIQKMREMKVGSLVLATSKLLKPANMLYESLGFRYVPMAEIGPIPYKRHTVAMELLLS
jgi:putative acetyltransferase